MKDEVAALPADRPRVAFVKSRANDPEWSLLSQPIGIMSVAAYLRRELGCEVRIIDIRLQDLDRPGLESALREFSPSVVGISALTFESDAIGWIAAAAKAVDPRIPVLLGGPHATAYPQRAVAIPGVDYLVQGEGEIAASRLIECLREGGDPSSVEGLVFERDGRIVDTGRAELIEELDRLPMPAYDLIPLEPYRHFDRFSRSGSGLYAGLFSSRGCPYLCVYCHNLFGKKFRARSARSLFDEIRYLHDAYGVREFEIYDDIFNLDRDSLLAFCDLVIESGLRVSLVFANGLRGDLLDEEQLERLRRAGTVYISFAVETGSPRIQKLIHKNIRLDAIARNIETAHRLGIHPHGFFMVGFPTETLQDMQMTVDFLLRSKLHTFNLFTAMPFEGTRLGEMARELGRAPVDDFSLHYLTRRFVNLSEVPDQQVNRLRQQTLLRFFLDPVRLWWLARHFPHKRGLPRLARVFFLRLRWRST